MQMPVEAEVAMARVVGRSGAGNAIVYPKADFILGCDDRHPPELG